MPSNVVKSYAEKTGKSEAEVEKLWDKAKEQVSKEYEDVEKDSDQYYSLVTGILKNMLGLKESETFVDLIDNEMQSLDKLTEEAMKKDKKDDDEEESDEEEEEEDSMDDEDEDEDEDDKDKKKDKDM